VVVGLDDLSMEEVRLNAYDAKANGNLDAYVSIFYYLYRNRTILYVFLFSSCHIAKKCQLHTHTHTHPFNGPFSGTTQVSQYQEGKTNLDFTEARDSE